MLTKSLHTITAATNVARYLLATENSALDLNAGQLAAAALAVLGYPDVDARSHDDPTVNRIVGQCVGLLCEERTVRAARIAPRAGWIDGDTAGGAP